VTEIGCLPAGPATTSMPLRSWRSGHFVPSTSVRFLTNRTQLAETAADVLDIPADLVRDCSVGLLVIGP
jgi:hypothetical protein